MMTFLPALLLLSQCDYGDETGNLLWPLGSGFLPYELRANYGAPEGSGKVNLHFGIDVIGVRKSQKVYALEDGKVVGLVDDDPLDSGLVVESKAGGRAFLYLHLDKDSIQFEVGEEVLTDHWLGNVVREDAYTEVAHLHLSRLGGDYATRDWAIMDKASVRNPLALIDCTLLGDSTKPEIVLMEHDPMKDEPLAFRANEGAGSNYHESGKLPPTLLDVIACVYDGDGRSENRLAPYELGLTVKKGSTVTKHCLRLDGALPHPESEALYNNEKPLRTEGIESGTLPADLRYYFVLTNGGDACASPPALERAWDASSSASREFYQLELTVKDVAGNTRKVGLTARIQ